MMEKLRVFLTPSSGTHLRHLVNTTDSLVSAGKSIDIVMPSVRQIDQCKQALLPTIEKGKPGQLFLGTFLAWANRILDQNQQAFRKITPGAEWVLLFEYFKNRSTLPDRRIPGSLALTNEILTELRESGSSIDELSEMQGKDQSGRLRTYVPPLRFLFAIAAERGLASASTLLCLANEVLENTRYTPRATYLIVAGFYEFNPIQKRLLRNLIECYQQTILYYPDVEDYPALKYLRPIETILERHAFSAVSLEKTESHFFNRFANTLFQNLPEEKSQIPIPKPQLWMNDWATKRLKLLRCPNRTVEVEAAARTIKGWYNGGLLPERMAVLYRGNYDYSRLIQLVFPRFGIPVAKTGLSLLASVPAQIIRKVFEINERNFSRDSVVDLTRFAELRKYYGSEIIEKFEYRSAAWGLSFQKESWSGQLQRRKEYLTLMLQADPEDTEDQSVLTKELQGIDEILPVIQQFLTDISLPTSATWLDFIRIVNELLRKYCLDESTDALFQEAIAKFRDELRHLRTLVKPEQVIERRHFGMAFTKLCEGVELPVESRSAGSAITIANIMDVRGDDFDAVILLGLVDGEFPAQRRENALLRNYQRQTINQQLGKELFRNSGVDFAEEKYLFFHLINRIKKYLLISYPQFDANGRGFTESPFLDEVIGQMQRDDIGKYIGWESISAAEVIPEIARASAVHDLLMNRFHYEWSDRDRNFFRNHLNTADIPIIEKRIEVESRRRNRMYDEWSGSIKVGRKHQESCFKKPFSVTRVQDYAWCPFLYLCRYVWQIAVAEEAVAELSPKSDGLLIHTLLENLLKDVDCENPDQWREYLSRDLNNTISQAVAAIDRRFRTVFGYIDDVVWQKKLADFRQGLQLLVERERAAAVSGFYPEELEKRMSVEFPMKFDGNVRPVIFRAKLDRIDRNASNSKAIIEYKRSRYSVQDPIKGVAEGIHFQLPFYMLAYQRLVGDVRFSGAYSYVFNDGEVRKGIFDDTPFKGVKRISESDLRDLLQSTEKKIEALLQRIFNGDFSLTPFDIKKRCQPGKCEYYEMCRIDTRSAEISDDDE